MRSSKAGNLSLIVMTGLFLANSALSAPKAKVTVCHYDEESAAWVAISIPAKAAEKHLANHDDGLAGEATSESGTVLGADCSAAVEAPVE